MPLLLLAQEPFLQVVLLGVLLTGLLVLAASPKARSNACMMVQQHARDGNEQQAGEDASEGKEAGEVREPLQERSQRSSSSSALTLSSSVGGAQGRCTWESLHDSFHKILCSQPEGQAAMEKVQALSKHRFSYSSRCKKHKVTIKVPGNAHPAQLPGDALTNLASIVTAKNPTCAVTNASIRYGCVIVTLDLWQSLEQGGDDAEALVPQLAAAAAAWMERTQLVEREHAQTPVILQVQGVLVKMTYEPTTNAWSMHPWEPSPGKLSPANCSITSVSPVSVLPPPSHTHSTQQSAPTSAGQTANTQPVPSNQADNSVAITVPVSVCVEAGVEITGWGKWGESPEGTADSQQQQDSSSSSRCVQVLASLEGCGYVPTRVEVLPHASDAQSTSELKRDVQVLIRLPAASATLSRPQAVNLQLWQTDTFLESGSMLLLPSTSSALATELEQLPWGSEDVSDVAEWISDFGQWLQLCEPEHQQANAPARRRNNTGERAVRVSTSDRAAHADAGVAEEWGTGVQLLRQAVLWGLPGVSTVVCELLMGLPAKPSPCPFAQLAHGSSGTGAPTAQSTREQQQFEEGSSPSLTPATPASRRDSVQAPDSISITSADQLGGLLHLALLCPIKSAMLACVLGWGRRWGSEEAAAQATTQHRAFAWRWEDACAAGFALVDILAMSSQEEWAQGLLGRLSADPETGRMELSEAGEREWIASLTSTPADTAGPSTSEQVLQRPALDTSAPLSSEAAFRAWANTQIADIAQKGASVGTCSLFSAVLRMAVLKGRAACVAEAIALCPYFPAYACGAVIMWRTPQHAEITQFCMILCRASMLLMDGMGWKTIANATLLVIHMRLDVAVELLLMSTLEQVRISWMLPLRALLFIAYGLVFSRCDKQYPWAQSLLLNCSCLAVSIAMDRRTRYLYTQHCQRVKQEQQTLKAIAECSKVEKSKDV